MRCGAGSVRRAPAILRRFRDVGEIGCAAPLDAETPIQERDDLVEHLGGRVRLAPAVIPVRHAAECHVDLRALERVAKLLALLDRDDRVLVAVDDQEGRVAGVDVAEWAHALGEIEIRIERTADEHLEEEETLRVAEAVRAMLVAVAEQLGRTEVVDDGLHVRGVPGPGVRGRTLHRPDAAARSSQRCQMSTGRGAEDRDAIRVEPVLVRVRADPTDGGLHVVDLRGEGRVGRPAVVRGDQGVAPIDEAQQVEDDDLVAIPRHPPAAERVEHDRRGAAVAIRGTVEIESQRARRSLRKHDVAGRDHVVRHVRRRVTPEALCAPDHEGLTAAERDQGA